MAKRLKTILLFGAPGAGKGTQGKILSRIPGFFHLSSGDMFRALDPTSDLGQRVVSYSSKGELVPDDLTIELWQQTIQDKTSCGAFRPQTDVLLLDGIPRNLAQAKALDKHLQVLELVHLFARDQKAMEGRMRRRALQEKRLDDADRKVIRRRFEIYHDETAPILKHYPRKIIKNIDAIGSPAEVLHKILKAIAPIQSRHFKNPLGGG